MSQFRNLVFEGGGVKGIAYAGAIKVLEDKKIIPDIERVAGTSAGAITAALLAVGANNQDIEEIVGSTKFNKFMDDSWGIVRDTNRLINEFGWYKGEAFGLWMQRQMLALTGNPNLTFGQLAQMAKDNQYKKYKDLYIVGTNLTLQEPLVFSKETTPGTTIWHAVRISMSIPLFFAAVLEKPMVWVDGGLAWNFPINVFDDIKYVDKPKKNTNYVVPDYTRYDDDHVYNKQTLGLRVDTKDEIKREKLGWKVPPREINNFADYAGVIVTYMMNMANKVHLHQNDWHRTVYIDAGMVGTTEFDLPDDKIKMLVNNGETYAKEYFKWFEDTKSKPINRVENKTTTKKG